MKTKITLLTLILSLGLGMFAQAPEKINYQAVARDLSGNPLISQPLPSVVFDIRQGSSGGPIVYGETQSLGTNQFGLFTAEIGGGTPTTGTFAAITWGLSSYYLQITIGADVMPATQLLSVPYALHANTASTGTPGANGISISWLGTSATIPASPTLNQAYYNSTDGKSYIWDGATWQILSQDGGGASLVAGTGIDITTGVVSNTGDLDSTNELITSAILNGTALEITEDGVLHSVSLASLSGADNWGTDVVNTSGINISGDGTSGNPLIITEGDPSPTNEIQDVTITGNYLGITGGIGDSISANSPLTNQVLTWNGSTWIAQTPGSGADQWGSQVVITDATLIGDGTAATPLSGFDGDYNSLTNQPTIPINTDNQDLSITGNNLTISGGTGTTISTNAPSPNQVLTYVGGNWIAQTPASGTVTSVTGTAPIVSSGGATPSISLANTTVTPGAYGSATQVPQFSVDAQGRLISVTNVAISTPAAIWSKTGNFVYPTNWATESVGIGLTTPTAKLDVNGSIKNNDSIISYGSSTNWGYLKHRALTLSNNFSNNAAGTLFGGRNSTSENYIQLAGIDNLGNTPLGLAVAETGFVGINTLEPTQRLDVNGRIRMRVGATAGYVPVSDINGIMTWTDPLTIPTLDDGDWIRYFDGTNNHLFNDNTHLVRIFGPSTTTANIIPSSNLFEIYSNGGDRAMMVDNTYMELGDVDGGQFGNKLIIDPEFVGNFQFLGGNVGIGTTIPTEKLDIVGQVKITDGVQGAGKVLTSNATGVGKWEYPLSPTKAGYYWSFFNLANSTLPTYETGTILTFTPVVSGTVVLNVNIDYNFDASLSNQIFCGIHVNTSGVTPTSATPLTESVRVGAATGVPGAGYGDIPVAFSYSMGVAAGTTYYVWIGGRGVNLNQAGASIATSKVIATLHQSNGL